MNVVFDFGAVLFTWRPLELVVQYFVDRAGERHWRTAGAHGGFRRIAASLAGVARCPGGPGVGRPRYPLQLSIK